MKDIFTGKTVGTGAIIPIGVGCIPSRVELLIGHNGMKGFWDKEMREGAFQAESVGFMNADAALIGSHLPLIGTTDTNIGSRLAVGQAVDIEEYCITIPAVAAGTAFTDTTHDIDAGKWGCFVLSVDGADGTTFTITPSASLDYDTEALAIAALPAVPAGDICMGIITVQATAGAIFNANTDALAGGVSGTPAAATNYYPGFALITGGINPYGDAKGDLYEGFTIGVDAMINTAGSEIYWKALR